VPISEQGKDPRFRVGTEPLGKIGCQQWLGGLIKHHYREAA